MPALAAAPIAALPAGHSASSTNTDRLSEELAERADW